ANLNTPAGKTDFPVALDALASELPNCGSTVLVVSWFGDDLRCGQCQLKPKIEQGDVDSKAMPWTVSDRSRVNGDIIVQKDGRPIYGGTPADRSVIEGIHALQERGQKVVFYPFILMEQLENNGLTDPWSGSANQPVLPWRGRITTSMAPGQPGSPDGSTTAANQVDAFFGTVQPQDFTISGDRLTYTGPDEWSYRRFVLHYAALCKAAGGVDSFCIGSEMRGLTQIRGSGHSFPAVSAFMQLAADVRSILGAQVKIGYASDWSEYFGYDSPDGNHYFHLDPLWAHNDIDFIGIDNYMPLSDWREGTDHTDVGWGSIYNLDYLKSNIEGGEGYDWYYASDNDRHAQNRS
ncbi:MAG: baseplate megatron protein TIM-barrel domain-containing protein, partial [Mangrovicoccus sp.]